MRASVCVSYLVTLSVAKIVLRRWQMNEIRVWTVGVMIVTGEGLSSRRQIYRSAIFSFRNPTRTGLVSSLVLRGGRPAADLVSRSIPYTSFSDCQSQSSTVLLLDLFPVPLQTS